MASAPRQSRFHGLREDEAAVGEICLGLTGWTTGYDVASANYLRNMVDTWPDQVVTEADTLEGERRYRAHGQINHYGPAAASCCGRHSGRTYRLGSVGVVPETLSRRVISGGVRSS